MAMVRFLGKLYTPREFKRLRQAIERENLDWPVTMTEVPKERWPINFEAIFANSAQRPVTVWRSRWFQAVLYTDPNGRRLTINRTTVQPDGHSLDGLTWDDIQEVKSQCGFGDVWALECYPPDDEVVNLANMRHLWLQQSEPTFGWRQTARQTGAA